MNISLTPELEKIVNQQVESGMYSNASEVIRDALRTFVDKKLSRKAKKELYNDWLRSELKEALEQAERGEFVEFDMEDTLKRSRIRNKEYFDEEI